MSTTANLLIDKVMSHPLAQQYKERAEYELQVIIAKQFDTYMLIVADFVAWAKNKGIMVGPGRGSVGGSLVAYCLGITQFNPMTYGLLFERFINPDRFKYPDCDIDFCFERRGEVVEYIKEKYGCDRVAQIATLLTVEAKQAIKDVARVMGVAPKRAQEMANWVMPNDNLKELNINPDDYTEAQVLKYAAGIQGIVRQDSKHAAGVVISDVPLQEIIAVREDRETGQLVIQGDMHNAELLGLLKIDLLGLKTLTTIQHIFQQIGIKDYDEIPLDNSETYKLLQRGDTHGVFQVESYGMRKLLMQIKPKHIEDIATVLALYRPGPMTARTQGVYDEEGALTDKEVSLMDMYVMRRQIRQPVEYLHPALEPVLQDTYGVILFQEQVIKIAELAGYTKAEADLFRAAVGKKKVEEIEKEKLRFIRGLMAKENFTQEQAELLYSQVEAQAGYSFNKAHATGYALISYYTAWLKVNFPMHFYVERLNEYLTDKEKYDEFMKEIEKKQILTRAPDINLSEAVSTIQYWYGGEVIRLGFSTIVGIGAGTVNKVLKERNKGDFKDLTDFCQRCMVNGVTSAQVQALINAGCFGNINDEEAELIIDHVSKYKNRYRLQRVVLL